MYVCVPKITQGMTGKGRRPYDVYFEFFLQVQVLFSMRDCFKRASYKQNAIKMLWLQSQGSAHPFHPPSCSQWSTHHMSLFFF